MKIQGLAVLSVLIIVPMAIILNVYSSYQIKTLDLQISYDTKLKNATYDAMKAFQMNMSNSTTSDLANSKMRDIKASINIFYNSLSSNFNMAGYGEDVLKDYVPAIVYTLYDGYYIYSAYNNNLDESDIFYTDASYKDGEMIYGLKPYIYYSCRYIKDQIDVVITYSLDSYITIQGTINGKSVNDSGYLLSAVNNTGTKYKNISIESENNKEGLKQNVYMPGVTNGERQIIFENNASYIAGSISSFPCLKINGVKYYRKPDGTTFSLLNEEMKFNSDLNGDNIINNENAVKYYKEAAEFKDRVKNYGLLELKVEDAVDMDGNPMTFSNGTDYIFKELENTSGSYIEDKDSKFNRHKMEVIKNSIETNLMAAISNYNKVSTSSVNFSMPKFEEYEWEFITQNVSMITFLQGLNIGGKVYNGNAIVQNTLTEDYVSEDSIYILYGDRYYRPTDSVFKGTVDWNQAIGLLNTDFERKAVVATYKDNAVDLKKNIYYYPKTELASYTSIINVNTDDGASDIIDYIDNDAPNELKKIYYTALGRERYRMYRVTNKLEKVQEDLKN